MMPRAFAGGAAGAPGPAQYQDGPGGASGGVSGSVDDAGIRPNSFTDNSGHTPTLTHTPKYLVPGNNVITWTATDDTGNEARTSQTVIVAYHKYSIARSFALMEEHVSFDRDRNLIINYAAARADPDINEYDIRIMKDYKQYNDDIAAILLGGSGGASGQSDHPNLLAATGRFQDSEFSTIFDAVDHGLAIFIPEYAFLRSLEVCGGGFSNPHLDLLPIEEIFMGDMGKARDKVESLGYHQIPSSLYTSEFGYDFGRINSTSAFDCNNGEFRYQIVIKNRGTHLILSKQYDEPNPELNTYEPPALWWGVYTAVWHADPRGN